MMKPNLRPISLSSRFLLLALSLLAIPSINDAFVSLEVSPMVNKMLEGRSRIVSSTLRSLDENGSGNRERRGADSLGGRGGRGRGGRSSRRAPPSSSSARPNKKKQSFGPNGHDYQQSTVGSIATGNNSMFSESDIHILLANRLQAKFDRDFPTADAIQMELINGGVYIQDELREWRADGVPYENSGRVATGGRKKIIRNTQYTKSPHSSSLTEEPQQTTTVDDDLVNKLVQERAKFKFTRQYDKADLVREGLRTKFNVIIDDRLRQWSVGGDFGSEHNAVRESMELLGSRGYIKSSSSLSAVDYGGKRNNDVDDDDGGDNDETTMDNDDGQEMEEYIQHHVDARAAMKKEGKFDTADKIRLDLAQRCDT